MGRQWNQIIESLGPLTGGTVSINANLGDIDALLTTIQADIADGIDISTLPSVMLIGSNDENINNGGTIPTTGIITSGTIDVVRDIDYVKLSSNSGTISGPNYTYNLGYAKRTSEARWTLNSFYVWYNGDAGQWEIVCTDQDDAGLVAYNAQNSRTVQNVPPKTGWTFNVDWSVSGFAISYEQPSIFPLVDGSGNQITSTTISGKQRLDVNLSSAGTTGSAVPTTANLYAGTDGTNLRAVSVDTTGRVNINQVRGTTTIGTLTASTTNGTLFATNSTRNYLLVQCTSGTAYLDTNGTATAANGVLLTSGQGITFEGSFIPTGAIAAITSAGTAQLIGRQG